MRYAHGRGEGTTYIGQPDVCGLYGGYLFTEKSVDMGIPGVP